MRLIFHFLKDWYDFLGYDPYLCSALFTDDEAHLVAMIAKHPSQWGKNLVKSTLQNLDFAKLLANTNPNQKINIFDADLNVKEFKTKNG